MARRIQRKTVTPDQVVRLLNAAFKADPKAVQAFFSVRVPCNQKLADHPTIQAGLAKNWRKNFPELNLPKSARFVISPVGIMNGFFGMDKFRMGPIASKWNLVCDACGAENVKALKGTRSGEKCPVCGKGKLYAGKLVGFVNTWKVSKKI